MAVNGHWVWVEYPATTATAPASPPPPPHLDSHVNRHRPPYYYVQHQRHPQTFPPSSAAADGAAPSVLQSRLTAAPFLPHGAYHEGIQSAQYYPCAAEALPTAGAVAASPSSSYYYGTAGGVTPHGFTTNAVTREQVSSLPLGYDVFLPGPTRVSEHTITGHSGAQQGKSKVLQPHAKPLKKRMKQLSKVVQSVYCEVCKIKCDTQEVLAIHKQGKKHKKKLHMLQASMTAKPTTALVNNAGNIEGSDAHELIVSHEPSKKEDLPGKGEELEAKKRRVLEGGAVTDGELHMLQASITAKHMTAPVNNAGNIEGSDAHKLIVSHEPSKKEDLPATGEELEDKKRRVLEGGAATDGELHMLQASITAKHTTAPVNNAGNIEGSDAHKLIVSHEPSKKEDLPATGEELEAKKRRVLEGGAATDGELHMLQASITAKHTTAPVNNAGNIEGSDAHKLIVSHEPSKKEDLPATGEELEAKKRRVLEGGAATDGVKVCAICNVVVNSPKVLISHLAGQKHAAMVKRQQEQQAPSTSST